MKSLALSLLAAVIIGLAPLPARADYPRLQDRYFLVVWSYEGVGNLPRDSHTFASFYDGDDLAVGRVAPATISWLSATGVVHLFGVQRGHNFTLSQTLARACRAGKRLEALGPYEITPGLYRRALGRIRLLNSGNVAYSGSALHSGTINCIQAAGDITDSSFHPGPVWGSAASRAVVRHLSPFFKRGGRINETVARMVLRHECR